MKKKHAIPTGVIILLAIVYFLAKPYLSPSNTGSSTPIPNNNPVATLAPGSASSVSDNTSTSGSGIQPSDWGNRKKTSGCIINGKFPDKACSPGAIFPNVTKADVCKSGYSSGVRNVPDSEKNEVYAEYGIKSHSPGQYEVDHYISLEIGGSNDIANLFPEAASPKPGFHEKDKVENYLHDQVCSGAITLLEAQTKISSNWLAVYNTLPNQ
jgi:hypothetical protein